MAFLQEKAGLTTWCEADMTLMTADGDAMPQFLIDMTATGNGAFQVGGGAPKAKYNALNGRPSILLPGADYYSSTATLAGYFTAGAGTLYLVFKCTAAPTNNATLQLNTGIFQTGNPGTTGGHTMGLHLKNVGGPVPTALFAGADDGGGFVGTAGRAINLNQWYTAVLVHSSGTLSLAVDDESVLQSVASGAWGLTQTPRLGIGTDATNHFFTGEIAAVLTYNVSHVGANIVKMARVLNYLRAKYAFTVSPAVRGDSLEQARALGSDLVWRRRRSVYIATPKTPMPLSRIPAAGLDLAQDFSIQYPYGPDPQGAATVGTPTGWAQDNHRRRPMRVRSYTVSLDKKTFTPKLRDNREFWTTYYCSETAARSLNLQRQGVMVIGKAPVRAFARDGYAWVPDVVSGLVTRIDPNQEKLSTQGLLLEPYANQEILDSSFVPGLANSGMTGSGTGVNGSAIAIDGAPPFVLFDPSVTGSTLKFTAGNPHTTDLLQAWTRNTGATSFPTPGAINCYLSCDHFEDASGPLVWIMQRSSDSHYWDDTNQNWNSAAIVYNAFPISSAGFARSSSKAIPMPATGTLKVWLGLQSGGTASRTAHVGHLQVESWRYNGNAKVSAGGVTSRIVSSAAASSVFRGADILRIYDNNGIVPSGPWTFEIWFRPVAIAPTTDFCLQAWGNSGVGNAFLEWNAAGNQLRLNMGGGAAFATVPWAPVVGTLYKVHVRYCPNGEWGNPANQVDVFVNGVKGTGTQQLLNYPGKMIDFSNMLRNANNNGDVVAPPCGYVQNVRWRPVALTDQEIVSAAA